MLKSAPILFILFFCLLFVSCEEQTSKYPEITDDFCSKIHGTKNDTTLSDYLAPISNKLDSSTGVFLLEEGDISMISRAWLTAKAEKTIDIQYFIFSADNIGLIACDYLIRAANRGVKIRLLVDDLLVESDLDELLALSKHPNLSIKVYNPIANIGKTLPRKLFNIATNFRQFNQRMHNKTFIVDNKIAITGGRNIADEYFDYDHEYNFRDRDALLLGKVVKSTMNSSFEQFWTDSLAVNVESISDSEKAMDTAQAYQYLHQYACNPKNFWPQIRNKIEQAPNVFRNIAQSGKLEWTNNISFVSDNPGKNDGSEGLQGGGISTDSLIQLVTKAKTSIYIQTPYLVTTKESRLLFSQIIQKDVDVHILTNSLASTDNLEAFNGYQRDREELLKTGVNIYEFKPDAQIRFEIMTADLQDTIDYKPIFGLHAKSMVIDNKIAVIGTFNLDPRSTHLNTECLTIIRNSTISEQLKQSMLVDIRPENAWQTTVGFNPDSVAGIMKQLKAKSRRIVPKDIL